MKLADVRELLVLIVGLALVATGLLGRPREPATVAIGVGLLVGPPAVAAAGGAKASEQPPPGGVEG